MQGLENDEKYDLDLMNLVQKREVVLIFDCLVFASLVSKDLL